MISCKEQNKLLVYFISFHLLERSIILWQLKSQKAENISLPAELLFLVRYVLGTLENGFLCKLHDSSISQRSERRWRKKIISFYQSQRQREGKYQPCIKQARKVIPCSQLKQHYCTLHFTRSALQLCASAKCFKKVKSKPQTLQLLIISIEKILRD